MYREKKEIVIYEENNKFQSGLIKFWRKYDLLTKKGNWLYKYLVKCDQHKIVKRMIKHFEDLVAKVNCFSKNSLPYIIKSHDCKISYKYKWIMSGWEQKFAPADKIFK